MGWEWTSNRYAWASNLDGTVGHIKLDKDLTGDFDAAMQIKTFTLHFEVQLFRGRPAANAVDLRIACECFGIFSWKNSPFPLKFQASFNGGQNGAEPNPNAGQNPNY